MSLPLQEGLAAPARIVKAYLLTEKAEGGLLSDVDTILPTVKSDKPVGIRTVWIHEHPTVVDTGHSPNLSHSMDLMTPFEFICFEYNDDPEQAAALAKNLASRVGASILKNFNKVKMLQEDPDKLFRTIRFNTMIPDGEVVIEGKSDKIPACGIIFEFVYPIAWMYCNKI